MWPPGTHSRKTGERHSQALITPHLGIFVDIISCGAHLDQLGTLVYFCFALARPCSSRSLRGTAK